MNIKRILALGVYYAVWCAIFYGMLVTAQYFYKDYNVNIVCLLIGLVLVFIIEPLMFWFKRKINEKYT